MTSPEDERVSWRLIGPEPELSKKQCRLIYSSTALFNTHIYYIADKSLEVFSQWYSSPTQQVYEVKLEDGNVYVKHASELSLQPFGQVKEN
uniref:Uncharacterized protein n=1 Tax=Cyprinus carpio TaxID=7962 RepID=A0A8C1L273_CYPCA